MYSIIPYNLFVGGLCIYYTVNFKKFSKKFFKPRNYSSWELFKFGIIYKRFEGTIQASVFVVAYFSGLMLVTGLWNPIKYVQDLAKIQGKIIDEQLKLDPQAQDYILWPVMNYFGVDKQFIDETKQKLERERVEYDLKNPKPIQKNEDDDDD